MKEIWCPLADMEKEGLWYAIVTRDRNGKVVSRERRKSRSFLKAWNQMMKARMADGNIQIKCTDGANRTLFGNPEDYQASAAIGQTNYGIRVGTGNTAVDISDFALETPILQGTGTGQMEHLACSVALPVIAAPTCSFVVSRTIVNNSGGVITVREAVIYCRIGPTYYDCVARDVLGTPQAVPDSGSITINWTIGVTV